MAELQMTNETKRKVEGEVKKLTDTKAFYEAVATIVSATITSPSFKVYGTDELPLVSNLIKEVGKALADAEIEARNKIGDSNPSPMQGVVV